MFLMFFRTTLFDFKRTFMQFFAIQQEFIVTTAVKQYKHELVYYNLLKL